jgi:hypothetical protein
VTRFGPFGSPKILINGKEHQGTIFFKMGKKQEDGFNRSLAAGNLTPHGLYTMLKY